MQILQNVWTALTTENDLILGIISIPFAFLEAFFTTLLFTTFFNLKTSKYKIIFFILTFSILGCLSRFFIPDPFGSFINIILCPILIMFFFKTSILSAIVGELLPLLINTIVDFVIAKSLHLLFSINIYNIISIPLFRILLSMAEYFFTYLAFLIMKLSNFNISSLKLTNKEQKITFYFNFLLGIIAISSQMYICIYYISILPNVLVVISIASLICYFIISIYSLISTNKLNIAKQNLEETRLMNKTLTILNDKIRAFRHDFNNIIQALGGYIQAKDIDGLEKYYSQLLKDCQEVNNLTGLNPESINNPAIYSLLASKYYLATEKGIEFNLDIFMDLNSIDMKIYEFCRILGILLDNAIQATQECEEKHIKVTIRKDNRCKRQLLIVENTYKEKDIDTEKIFEKGYSTKEGNTGLGLWEVRQILLKNTNLNLFTSKDDTYFKQQLEIYKS